MFTLRSLSQSKLSFLMHFNGFEACYESEACLTLQCIQILSQLECKCNEAVLRCKHFQSRLDVNKLLGDIIM